MKKLLLLAMAVAMVGCFSPTPYQKSGYTGGFNETQLQPDIFSVRFRGNAFISSDRAGDYCLLRCAEITLERGYKYFAILDGEKKVRRYVQGDGDGGINTYYKPVLNNTIKLLKNKPTDAKVIVFDAEFLRASISEKYKLKLNSQKEADPAKK